jgi:hypothetical protein
MVPLTGGSYDEIRKVFRLYKLKKEDAMKNSMIKLLVSVAIITSCLYAGGDIAPVVEPVTEPDSDSGSAMGIVSIALFVFITSTVGSFFINKEQQ